MSTGRPYGPGPGHPFMEKNGRGRLEKSLEKRCRFIRRSSLDRKRWFGENLFRCRKYTLSRIYFNRNFPFFDERLYLLFVRDRSVLGYKCFTFFWGDPGTFWPYGQNDMAQVFFTLNAPRNVSEINWKDKTVLVCDKLCHKMCVRLSHCQMSFPWPNTENSCLGSGFFWKTDNECRTNH